MEEADTFDETAKIVQGHRPKGNKRMAKTWSSASVSSVRSEGGTGPTGRGIANVIDRHTKSVASREEAEKQAKERKKKAQEAAFFKRQQSKTLRQKAKLLASGKPKKKYGIPKTLQVGDACLIKQGLGIVRYIGPVERKKKKSSKTSKLEEGDNAGEEKEPEIYVGIELKESSSVGKNNGTVFGKSYFKTEGNQKKGVFTRKIKRVLQPERILHMLAQEVSKSKAKGRLVNERFDEALAEETVLFRMENDQLTQRIAELEAELEAAKADTRSVTTQNSQKSDFIHVDMSKDDEKKDDSGKNKLAVEDGPTIDLRGSLSNLGSGRGSIKSLQNAMARLSARNLNVPMPKRGGRALFREKSENFWDDDGADGLARDLMAEVERMAREQRASAVEKLNLPNQNSSDDEFKSWLSKSLSAFCDQGADSRKHRPTSGDRAYTMPNLENEDVLKALITVARMLSSLTQPAVVSAPLTTMAEEVGGSDSEESESSVSF